MPMVRDGSGSDDLNLPTPQPIDPDAPLPEPRDTGPSGAAPVDDLPSEFGVDEPVGPEAAPPAPPAPTPTPGGAPTGTPPHGQVPGAPPPAQAVPGTPVPPPPTTVPAKAKGTPWGWIIGCTCGGCLGIVLLFVLLVFIAGLAGDADDTASSSEDATSGTELQDSGAEEGVDENAETVNLGPGATEAQKYGGELKPGWVAQVSSNSPDFEEVSLRLGPTEGDWQRWAKIKWDGDLDAYTLVSEGEIAFDTDATGPKTPGKELAVQTALANSPGWTAKVVRHAADWRTAVVWIGPPQSEWVGEVRLRWRDKLGVYELEGETMIPQDEGP